MDKKPAAGADEFIELGEFKGIPFLTGSEDKFTGPFFERPARPASDTPKKQAATGNIP